MLHISNATIFTSYLRLNFAYGEILHSLRLALLSVEQTHNTPLFTELRQRLQQATGDSKFSPDTDDAVSFVTATNKKAAILVCMCVYLNMHISVFLITVVFVCMCTSCNPLTYMLSNF